MTQLFSHKCNAYKIVIPEMSFRSYKLINEESKNWIFVIFFSLCNWLIDRQTFGILSIRMECRTRASVNIKKNSAYCVFCFHFVLWLFSLFRHLNNIFMLCRVRQVKGIIVRRHQSMSACVCVFLSLSFCLFLFEI